MKFASYARCLSLRVAQWKKIEDIYHICETVILMYRNSVAKCILIIKMHKIWSVDSQENY